MFKINSFNNQHNFPINTLHIENTFALEIQNTNNSKIVNNDDNKEENEINMTFNSSKEVGLKKDSNKEVQDQKGQDYNLDLKNTPTQQNTKSSTTKSYNSIVGFNFAAAGDWACTGKAKNTVKNIIDHDPELVLTQVK